VRDLASRALVPRCLQDGTRLAPYQRDLEKPLPVKYDALLELLHRRRSVRWFLPEPVPRDFIDRAVEAASLSPSACNRQPYQFRIFDDPQLVEAVADMVTVPEVCADATAAVIKNSVAMRVKRAKLLRECDIAL
jgi:hypothetical protein